MSLTEIVLVVFAIALAVLFVVALITSFERRSAQKLAAPLVSRTCPECGKQFGAGVVRSAYEIHALVDPPLGKKLADIGPLPPRVGVACPHCSAKWEFCEGGLARLQVEGTPGHAGQV
jgi:hypothetical protein